MKSNNNKKKPNQINPYYLQLFNQFREIHFIHHSHIVAPYNSQNLLYSLPRMCNRHYFDLSPTVWLTNWCDRQFCSSARPNAKTSDGHCATIWWLMVNHLLMHDMSIERYHPNLPLLRIRMDWYEVRLQNGWICGKTANIKTISPAGDLCFCILVVIWNFWK